MALPTPIHSQLLKYSDEHVPFIYYCYALLIFHTKFHSTSTKTGLVKWPVKYRSGSRPAQALNNPFPPQFRELGYQIGMENR